MLTVMHPEAVPLIEALAIGILPIPIYSEDHSALAIKATKEFILTAKMRRGFKIYVSPISLPKAATIGLISAFFDDEDEPLVIYTPLFDNEVSRLLLATLGNIEVDIYFFDEFSREWLSYVCKIQCPAETRDHLSGARLLKFAPGLQRSAVSQMPRWFGRRSTLDDRLAISVDFVEALVPEDQFILDSRPENHSFRGGPFFSLTRLIREEPGADNEQEIARLLKRLFSPESIYLNPLRAPDGREIADILIVTESDAVAIQAKDSPNTEASLNRTVDRKKRVTRKALSKATNQLQGAIRYLRSMPAVKMTVKGETTELELGQRTLRGLILVKELFNAEFSEYNRQILSMAHKLQVPCIVLDYPELLMYMTRLKSDKSFFEAFDRVYSIGVRTGQFPRLRIWPQGSFSEGGEDLS